MVIKENILYRNGSQFDILNDLKSSDDTYLKRNTKINVFREVKNSHPELYEKLRMKGWYSAYIKEVEDTPEFITPKELENKNDDEVMSMIADSFNKLSDNLQEMNHEMTRMNTNTKLEEALIQGIVDKGKEIAVDDIKKELKDNLQLFIEETYGSLPDRIILKHEEVEYAKTGIFHEAFEKVLKLVNMNLPVMLTGGAGAGKNFMLEQVADALNMSFYYTSTITQEYKLTGFIDGGGRFHETEFFKAFTEGGIFMLDEIDASIPEALVILNGAIANGYFDFPNGREIAHEDFRVVCAGNTVGLGADMVYTGRNVLDGATLDRFVLIEITYDNRIEEMLCQDRDLRNFLYDVRKSVDNNKINHIVGMRAFKYSYEMMVNEFDKEFIIKSVITKGLGKDDINVIKYDIDSDKTEWHKIFYSRL